MVEVAFAQAPAWAVDNFDGSRGIQLHVIWDDADSVPNQILTGPFAGSPSQFQSIKTEFFGSAADRVLGGLVFENGFELGSTTAWSETVP